MQKLINFFFLFFTACSFLYSAEESWKPLFDGKTLDGWTVPKYGGDGDVSVKEGKIIIEAGTSMTGIKYDKVFPTADYEIQYEARRTGGSDFFAALTFPVKKSSCTFVNGGWGGGTTGLSSIDGSDASENETSTYYDYADQVWYRFRIRVTEKKIEVWIAKPDKDKKWDEKLVIDLNTDDKLFSIRMEMGQYKPLGLCTWSTAGEIRNLEYRQIPKK
jgi:hypothetical protein